MHAVCTRGVTDHSSASSTLARAMAFFPALLSLGLQPLLASDAAFAVVFGIFIVAMLTMIVIVIRWSIRRDRQGRVAWRQRQQQRMSGAEGDVPPPARP